MSGWFALIQLISASPWKYLMVSPTPASLKAARHHGLIGGTWSVRRWSSQVMAGRSGLPCLSRLTTVPRWVVTATPLTADLGIAVSAHRRWQAAHTACQ